MSELIAQKGWDIIGLSEDFNYHEQLMSKISNIYQQKTQRQSIPLKADLLTAGAMLGGNRPFDTDGLNLLYRNTISSVTGETIVGWSQKYGTTSDGADQLIDKGYRYYCVSIAPGFEVDVYIHHMDAETDEKSNAARKDNLRQIAQAILDSDNKRPILIMGDTNCRYTRDPLVSYFFKMLQDDSKKRFDIHDPWAEIARKDINPNYPNEGSPDITVPRPFDGTPEGFEAFQTREVVDKIWYVNNTDAKTTLKPLSYLHDTDFTWPDGTEISDHYPIVVDFEIELKEGTIIGGDYYLRNVATGKYLAAGQNWGTHAIVDNVGAKISLDPVEGTDNGFNIRPTTFYHSEWVEEGSGWNKKTVEKKVTAYLGADGYMDNGTKNTYTFNPVSGTSYFTISLPDNKYLTVQQSDKERVDFNVASPSDPYQQWEKVSVDSRLDDLRQNATPENPINATFLIGGYNMCANDYGARAWGDCATLSSKAKFEIAGGEDKTTCNTSARFYNDKASGQSKNTPWSLKHTDNNLPNGIYEVGCNIFSVNVNLAELKFNGTTVSTIKLNDTGDYSGSSAGVDLNTDKTKVGTTITVTDHQLVVEMKRTAETASPAAVFFDNLYLIYKGPSPEDAAAKERVRIAIEDAQAKANAAGLTQYNNKAVIEAYNHDLIAGDGRTEEKNTYLALAKAATKQYDAGADMSYTILNNSFERGNLDYWTVNANGATVVEYGSEDVVKGNYYLNAPNGGEISYTSEVTMPAGVYELSAYLTPGATLKGGDGTTTVTAVSESADTPTIVKFLVTKGISTASASHNSAFTADHFVLKRLANHLASKAVNLIQIAMKDATAQVKTLTTTYNEAEWNQKMAPYQAMIDNLDLADTDGSKEFREIYDILRTYVFAQPIAEGAGTDYTKAIINPSFEIDPSTAYGWDLDFQDGDTSVKPTSDDGYKISNSHGNNLFNTWNSAGQGTPIQQEITNLPSGHYELSAVFASDAEKYVFMEVIPCAQAEGVPVTAQSKIFKLFDDNDVKNDKVTTDKTIGVPITLSFDIADDGNDDTPGTTVIIRVGGCNGENRAIADRGTWYKVDNFQLIRTGNHDLCFFYNRLKKAIEEADKIAGALPDKYSDTWDSSKYWNIIREHQLAPHDYENNGEISNEYDPLHGGNGIAEIMELFGNLRSLVFSQTETEANMSGSIFNNSFELGDYTGWDIEVEAGDCGAVENVDPFTTEGIHGKYLFNVWNNDWAKPLRQTIPDMPAGRYKLTAKVASFAGNKFFLGANNKISPIYEIPEGIGDRGKGEFHEISLIFDVPVEIESKNVTIGLYPTTESTITGEYNDEMGYYLVDQDSKLIDPSTEGPWFKADQFRLELISRYLDIAWTPEAENAGTIMLPFALDKEEYNEYLGKHGFTAHYIDQLEKNETPADIERNLYRIIKLSEPLDELEANKPYLLIKDAAQPAAAKS
ncbi:MAG: hypothetical protein K2K97_10215, partial [Muribaculaceae bacterium]|nr:hypothetical protein [Muribaculaceae bacterium]